VVAVESIDEARERLRPYVDRARRTTGWSFDVEARLLGPDRPWDYMRRAKELMAAARTVLDMGTGGGERFGELLDGYEGRAIATERWHVNAPIAAARLKPLGAEVVRCRSKQLPIAGESIDLVLNRHEGLEPAEWPACCGPAAVSTRSKSETTGRSCGSSFHGTRASAITFTSTRPGLRKAGYKFSTPASTRFRRPTRA
jgi:hypothetical protein